jgi:hypothetical protein
MKKNEIVLFETADNEVSLQVQVEDESVSTHRMYNFDNKEKAGIDSYCSLRNVKIDKQLMELLRIVKVQSVC